MATNLRDLLVDLNKVRYSSLDFATHNDDLFARMQSVFAQDFNDFAISSHAIMFLDLISITLDTLSFYLDRRASDLYIETARTRKSISKLARQLGYKPRGAVPASTDLTVALKKVQTFSVPIAAGFQFKTKIGDTIYEAAQAVTYNIGDGPSDTQKIPVYQGRSVSEIFVSTGLSNQLFELTQPESDEYVSSGSVIVYVNGTLWEEKEFLTYEATDQYEVSYIDDPCIVRFGDGISGNIPDRGATIQVKYIVTKGTKGQTEENSITKTVLPLVISSTTIPLIINNEESSVAASDLESLQEIKTFAGKIFNTRNVAVTKSDYEALASFFADPLFGRVAVATALSSKSAATDLELQQYIKNIQDVFDALSPEVTSYLNVIVASLDTLLSNLNTVDANLNSYSITLNSHVDSFNTFITKIRETKALSQECVANSTSIGTFCTTLINSIDDISTSDHNAMTAEMKAIFLSQATLISNAALDTSTQSTIITDNSTELLTDIDAVRTDVLSIIDTLATDIEAIDSAIAIIGEKTPASGIYLEVNNITTAVSSADADIDQSLSLIEDHVSQILAADCEANLVSVPILAKNSEGFYQAPSIGLIKSLQSFLDARKETTQLVRVISGAIALLPVVLTCRVAIFTGYSENTIAITVKSAIDSILRGRRFGVSLYISDIISVIKLIPGVSFVNIEILGHQSGANVLTTKLDADGNIIIESSEVLTKGTVTINIETAV